MIRNLPLPKNIEELLRKGQRRKTPLFVVDMNEALTFAENDIKNNWEVYRERFMKETEK